MPAPKGEVRELYSRYPFPPPGFQCADRGHVRLAAHHAWRGRLPRKLRVLDAGAGTGRLCGELAAEAQARGQGQGLAS